MKTVLLLAAALWASSPVIVTGRIIDDDGQPIASAEVQVRSAESRVVTARTDSGGAYRLVLAGAGDSLEVRVRHIGHRPALLRLRADSGVAVANVQLLSLAGATVAQLP